MTIATFLTDQQQAHVDGLLADQKELLVAHSWKELKTIIRMNFVTVLILNPAAAGDVDVDAATDFLRLFPSLPVIAYVALDPTSFRAILELSQRGLATIVLQGFEDSPERFKATLDGIRANPLALQILSGLRPILAQLPVKLRRAVQELFEAPHRFGRAHDLALVARLSLAGLYREFEMAKLVSPRRLIIAAKLLQGVGYLRDPGLTVIEAAKKVGYDRPRIFGQHSLEVLGVTPSRIKADLSLEKADRRFRAWLEIP